MGRNVEIKARLRDASGVRARVEALAGAPAEHLQQSDTFFNVPSGRLKLRELGDGSAELIFYNRPDAAGPKLSSYAVAQIAAPAQLRDVLARSLGTRGVVRKQRVLYLIGQTRVHLDEVEGLGMFLELEVVLREDQAVTDGQAVATDLLEKLQIPSDDLLTHAYIDLLTATSR